MAFGDVVQTASGGIANTRVISNVQAGNTLLLFGIFRSFEGSEPTSVTDDVNAGSYAEIFDYGNASTNEPQISCYMLANTAAGATTVTTTGTTPFRWGLVEVEGVLVNSGVGTGNVVTANTNTVTAAAAVVPNNSVSFAGIDTQLTNSDLTPTQAGWAEIVDFNSLEVKRQFVTTSASLNISGTKDDLASGYAVGWAAFTQLATGPDYTQRKNSTFTATHTLGTVPNSVTINALAVTLSNATTTTVDVTIDAAITTSAQYNLVIANTVAVTSQTQTVQVNVFGVVPSNNPAQKDGTALASLTGVQIRITAGANLNGTQVYYSPTQTTDATGNFSTLDVSTSAAAAADPVLMQVLTAAGDSITSAETVGLI
jgi:hypothetical protein